MKSILVTGGLGFIGSNFIKKLNNNDNFIINIDKISTVSSPKHIFSNLKNYIFYKVNINNKETIKKIILKYKPQKIFNFAAETHVDRSIENPVEFIKSNIIGVFNILETIKNVKNYNPRFIQISTDEVFGDVKIGKKSQESDRFYPSSPYSASKASSDLIIFSYVRTYNLDAIITHSCNNFGPGQFPEKLIPKIIYNLHTNKNIPIYGKGKNIREWIFVEDNCEAIINISKKGNKGQNYNIGSGKIMSNLEIAKKIIFIYKEYFGKKSSSKIIFVKDRPGHDICYSLNSEKTYKKIGKNFLNDFDENIEKTVKWYIRQYNNKFFSQKKNFNRRMGLIN